MIRIEFDHFSPLRDCSRAISGVNKFLALLQSDGPYSPEKLAAGGYERAHVAASIKKVKKAIELARSRR